MATKFADIAKGPNDLLNDDYTSKISVKCKKGLGPVTATIETERGSGGSLSSKIGTKFAYAGLNFDKLQFKPDGSQVLETSLSPCPGCLMTFKGSKGADLGVEYAKGSFMGTGTLDVKDMSKFSSSACIGIADGVKVGGTMTYSLTGKAGLSEFNVGASYGTGPLYASVTTSSKISSANLGVMYKVNSNLTLASNSTHSKANPVDTVVVGGLYTAPFGKVKGKFGTDGVVSACLIKEVVPKVTVTVSGSAPAKDLSNIKYGVGFVI